MVLAVTVTNGLLRIYLLGTKEFKSMVAYQTGES